MLREFINLNKNLSNRIDRIISNKSDQFLLRQFIKTFRSSDVVADVGGGKKPIITLVKQKFAYQKYDGIDYDAEELLLAPRGLYDETHTVDVTRPPAHLYGRYDKIICCNTLEHVTDGPAAILGLARLLKPGGECYIKVPCRHAMFARLNRNVPERIKRLLLFFLFPDKKTDGFPAFYIDCSIARMTQNAKRAGLALHGEPSRFYYSSYFTFFFPFYLAWRSVTLFQYLSSSDYCESFEIVLKKEDRGAVMAVSNEAEAAFADPLMARDGIEGVLPAVTSV
jgi:SAM-dependent methyltransferase